mgnify:CR=1 FL=1
MEKLGIKFLMDIIKRGNDMKKIVIIALSIIILNDVYGQGTEKVEPVHEIFMQFPQVRDFTRSESQNEIYFTIQSPNEEISAIALLQIKDDALQPPVIAPFSGKYKDLEPFLSPDNKRLYFVSNRPVNQKDSLIKNFDIWYVEREELNNDWSEPINIGLPINTEHAEFYPSVSANGNLYFTRNSPETVGEDDIFLSQWIGNEYDSPIALSKSINSEGYEFNAYIAPDESYIIFSGYNRKDGFGSGDLYISRRDEGTWSSATNLGPDINSSAMDYCPFVDINSGTLYFTSRRSDVENGDSKDMTSILTEINKYENGLSRIYKVAFKNLISK